MDKLKPLISYLDGPKRLEEKEALLSHTNIVLVESVLVLKEEEISESLSPALIATQRFSRLSFVAADLSFVLHFVNESFEESKYWEVFEVFWKKLLQTKDQGWLFLQPQIWREDEKKRVPDKRQQTLIRLMRMFWFHSKHVNVILPSSVSCCLYQNYLNLFFFKESSCHTVFYENYDLLYYLLLKPNERLLPRSLEDSLPEILEKLPVLEPVSTWSIFPLHLVTQLCLTLFHSQQNRPQRVDEFSLMQISSSMLTVCQLTQLGLLWYHFANSNNQYTCPLPIYHELLHRSELKLGAVFEHHLLKYKTHFLKPLCYLKEWKNSTHKEFLEIKSFTATCPRRSEITKQPLVILDERNKQYHKYDCFLYTGTVTIFQENSVRLYFQDYYQPCKFCIPLLSQLQLGGTQNVLLSLEDEYRIEARRRHAITDHEEKLTALK